MHLGALPNGRANAPESSNTLLAHAGLAQKVGQLITGNADGPSALSAQREERQLVLAMRMKCIQRDADETSAFPAFTGLMHPKSTLWAGRAH